MSLVSELSNFYFMMQNIPKEQGEDLVPVSHTYKEELAPYFCMAPEVDRTGMQKANWPIYAQKASRGQKLENCALGPLMASGTEEQARYFPFSKPMEQASVFSGKPRIE